jgi:hypothetical protein
MTSHAASISRRHVLLHGAGALAMVPTLARAAQTEPSSQTTAIPATDFANRLSIEASIAGKGPFRFVIDTGADRTVIATEVARQLQLPTHAPVIVQGIAHSVDSVAVRAPDFAVGGLSFGDLDAPILPRGGIGADGYLGLDILDRHRVIFDFERHELWLGPPRPAMFGEQSLFGEAIIRAFGTHGRLRAIDCRVDNVNAWAFIDSGAEVSVGNSALFQALAANGTGFELPAPVILTDVTGGSIGGRTTQVKRVHLTGFDFSDSALVIADLQIFDLWGLADRPALFIGMNLLRQFARVTIDYGRKEYRFRFADAAIAVLS